MLLWDVSSHNSFFTKCCHLLRVQNLLYHLTICCIICLLLCLCASFPAHMLTKCHKPTLFWEWDTFKAILTVLNLYRKLLYFVLWTNMHSLTCLWETNASVWFVSDSPVLILPYYGNYSVPFINIKSIQLSATQTHFPVFYILGSFQSPSSLSVIVSFFPHFFFFLDFDSCLDPWFFHLNISPSACLTSLLVLVPELLDLISAQTPTCHSSSATREEVMYNVEDVLQVIGLHPGPFWSM